MTTATLPDWKQRQRWRGYLAAAVLLSSHTLAQPDLTWIDRTAVAAREVLVNTDRGDRPLTVLVSIAAEVDAPPTAIWEVLRACDVAPEYVPNVVSCKRLEGFEGFNDGRAELFVQTIKPVFFMPTFEHVFRLDYTPYTRMEVRRVSGPLARLDGTWWLLPQDNGRILLVYELALDPGMPIPRFLVRATLKRDLPKIVQAIRERAEAAR